MSGVAMIVGRAAAPVRRQVIDIDRSSYTCARCPKVSGPQAIDIDRSSYTWTPGDFPGVCGLCACARIHVPPPRSP